MMENEEEDYYLVYFKDIASFEEGGRNFIRSKQGENIICVCHWRSLAVTCNYCEDLKLPARYVSKAGGGDENTPVVTGFKISNWVIGEGERIKISKSEGVYDFVKIQ